MKQVLLKAVCILSLLSVFLSFSQTYKIDENKIYFWFSGWEQQYTEQYSYANGGNKETNLLELSFPNLENSAQYNKTYNANNDIILNVYQTWNGSGWDNDYQIVYEYQNMFEPLRLVFHKFLSLVLKLIYLQLLSAA